MVNTNEINHEKETKTITKHLKSEIKSWKKDLGLERSKKIKAERNLATLESVVKDLKSRSMTSTSSQTNNCLDVPYLVTSSLPPIFCSQLCKISKPINNLTRSLPNISTLRWVKVTEEDLTVHEAEDALNVQYDRQIDDYYREAKLQAEAVRQVHKENGIGKLIGEENN